MLTGACDLGVRTVTASQVQYTAKLFVIPATIQRQAPIHQDSTWGCGCLSVPVSRSSGKRSWLPIRQERSIALMCCSSCVPKEHCGRPCCVATTKCPVHSGVRFRRLFPSPRTLNSAFLFARTQTTQCRSSTLTGSSTSPVPQIPEQIVEAVKHIPQE